MCIWKNRSLYTQVFLYSVSQQYLKKDTPVFNKHTQQPDLGF